ncbi:hypothetical protein BESB_075550 [Besnoitia besnoiti]|uniref:Uncharacterized protein n=1 Tax=Besnoitia besnoiti TaxID=94643 RepID=A0A2A9MFH3_BESBE|nr:uncharacterized protein BESB_075550 [Besnoitia besnoiti]PFH34403.1 hypothetical protein BESB_075550 [Besnoitia besnoiti]
MDRVSLLFTAAAGLAPDTPTLLGLSPPQIILVLQHLLQHLRQGSPKCGVFTPGCDGCQTQEPACGAVESTMLPSTGPKGMLKPASGTSGGFPSTRVADVLRQVIASCDSRNHSRKVRSGRCETDGDPQCESSQARSRWAARLLLAVVAQQVAVEVLSAWSRRYRNGEGLKSKSLLSEYTRALHNANRRALSLASTAAASSFHAAVPALLSAYTMLSRVGGALHAAAAHYDDDSTWSDRGAVDDSHPPQFVSEDKMTGPASPRNSRASRTRGGLPGRIPLALLATTRVMGPELHGTTTAMEALLSMAQTEREASSNLYDSSPKEISTESMSVVPENSDPEAAHDGEATRDVTTSVLKAIDTVQQGLAFVCRLLYNASYGRSRGEQMAPGEVRRLLLGKDPSFKPESSAIAKL